MDRCLALAFVAGAPSRLAIDGDDTLRAASQSCDPGDEAALELLVIQHGEDVTEVIVRWRSVGERAKAAQ